jgi:uncharacterized glyoxalase superfamily protein PhnB
MNYYVYIVLLIGSLVSCSESSRHFPRYEDFPDEKALNAQVIHLDTALFRYPFRVAVKDGIAIIMDLHNVDYFFHAFIICIYYIFYMFIKLFFIFFF